MQQTLNQTIKIGQTILEIQGDLENPLFDCQQVLIHILGYAKSGENRFYKDNKKNEKYVREAGCPPIKKWYFTEIGLYRCLFTSQKQIALEFQEQVALLLKDIRIGNITLQVQKECETTQLIEEQKETLLQYITQNNDILIQVQALKTRLEQCSFIVYVYEQEIVSTGEIYRGSSIEPKIRSKTHKYNSSCVKLKEAYQRGDQINIYILGQAKVFNDNERDYFEQQFILAMPSDKKLNLKTPQPNTFYNISQEHIEYTKNAVQTMVRIPLDEFLLQFESEEQPIVTRQIGVSIKYSELNIENHINYINDISLDSDFKQKIYDIKQFLITNKFTPRDSDQVSSIERSMGQFLVKLRNAYRTNSTANFNLTPERYAYVKYEIPTVLHSDNQPFFDKTLQLKTFIQANNRLPKQRGQNNNNQTESELYDWISHRRQDYKKGKLHQECLDFIKSELPDFEFIPLTDEEKFTQKIQQIKEFYNQHNRYPIQKDNKVLQTYIKTLKSANSNQQSQTFQLTPQRKQYIDQILPNFPW